MTRKELLANDPITKAVDECNKILEAHGLKVRDLEPKSEDDAKRDYFKIPGGKIYTKDTLIKLEELDEVENENSKKPYCPNCFKQDFKTERRPDGYHICNSCGYKWKQ